jgi:hypothetical protein
VHVDDVGPDRDVHGGGKAQAPGGAANQQGPDSTGAFRPGAGTVIVAELAKSLDAKKAKVGDRVECDVVQDLLYQGKVIIPHDAKVLGHVTVATSATKEQPQSRLGLIFEKIVLKDKRELPFQYPAVVAALAPPIRRTTVPTTQMTDMPVQMEKGRTTGGAAIDAVGANAKLAGLQYRHAWVDRLSPIVTGEHQHYFTSATSTLTSRR